MNVVYAARGRSRATHGSGTGGAVAARIDGAASALFGECLSAFQAFADLDQLAEDLRILSLNAELAAGRAGDRGRAVRALTQYTRALVSRLAMVQADVFKVRVKTYASSAMTLNELRRLHQLERATAAVGRPGDEDGPQGVTAAALAAAQQGSLDKVVASVGAMVDGIGVLAERTKQVLEVVSQSGSIATNIAVEAASAGQYEAEFRTVAETMRRYVTMLRDIADKANSAVRAATQTGANLQRHASHRGF